MVLFCKSHCSARYEIRDRAPGAGHGNLQAISDLMHLQNDSDVVATVHTLQISTADTGTWLRVQSIVGLYTPLDIVEDLHGASAPDDA